MINGRSNRNARRGRYGSSTFLNSPMQCSDSFCLFVRFSPSVRSSLLTAGRQAAIACDRPSLWNFNPGDQDCPILEVRIANSLSQESQSYIPVFFDKVSVFARHTSLCQKKRGLRTAILDVKITNSGAQKPASEPRILAGRIRNSFQKTCRMPALDTNRADCQC